MDIASSPLRVRWPALTSVLRWSILRLGREPESRERRRVEGRHRTAATLHHTTLADGVRPANATVPDGVEWVRVAYAFASRVRRYVGMTLFEDLVGKAAGRVHDDRTASPIEFALLVVLVAIVLLSALAVPCRTPGGRFPLGD
jgi:hypothetical protein